MVFDQTIPLDAFPRVPIVRVRNRGAVILPAVLYVVAYIPTVNHLLAAATMVTIASAELLGIVKFVNRA